MAKKRIRQTTLVALIVALFTLGVAPSAFADTWVGYGDNFKTKQTCTNRGVYMLKAQPYSVRFLDYHCQGSHIPGRWSLLMLEEDFYGCFAARSDDMQRVRGGSVGPAVVPADC